MPIQIQDIPSHSFSLQYVICLCQKIVAAKFSPRFNDSGSLATVRDLPYLVTTNLYCKFPSENGCIIIQKEHVPNYQQAHNYLLSSIKNEAQDVWNKGHSQGAFRRNNETGELSRPRQMCSTEMYISQDSTTTLMDILDSNIPTPEQYTQTRETYDLAIFIDMLTTNILASNQTLIINELNNFPSLSPAGLLKYCMYTYGMDYAKSVVINDRMHNLIQTLWSQSPLPADGLITWNANLPTMRADLLEAEANYPFIIKRYILRALKPNHSEEELFASDTPRESLRKSLGHSEAGVALLNLVTLLHFTSKDDYQSHVFEACGTFLDKAVKVFSDARVNYTDVTDMHPTLKRLLQNNTIPTREAMRHFLAPVVYDQKFQDLTTRKQNTIRRLIRSVGILSEGLRPLIGQNDIPLSYT